MALSPVRSSSQDMCFTAAHWRMMPQWIMAWYRSRMVVAWCRITTSARNSHVALGWAAASTKTIPLRKLDFFSVSFFTSERSANPQCWPLSASSDGTRLQWIVFTSTGLNWLLLSGPRSSCWFGRTEPALRSPATTRPTPFTVKTPSMWNSTGALGGRKRPLSRRREGTRCRNDRRRGRPSPETLETWKIGHALSATRPSAASWRSPSPLTRTGCLRTALDLTMLRNSVMFSSYTFAGAMSIFVTTNMNGMRRARAIPRCSRDIR
mmetsp:Transcript_82679/g.246567  ORF Transcript_82679/g.246567 Transcript_82679/m.246567 type:complete len:265 (-) Transcript_82679:636-1430(-)